MPFPSFLEPQSMPATIPHPKPHPPFPDVIVHPPLSPSPQTIPNAAGPQRSSKDQDASIPNFVNRYVNLASIRLGAKAIYATDEFFAAKERMLNPEPAVFYPGKYDENGKWMDGWETRRRRTTGYDYCIVRLARPGVIRGIELDTSHFTGNFPPAASLDGLYCPHGDPNGLGADWVEVLPSVTLKGDSKHYHAVHSPRPFTHVRVNIYPDGGVARLRVYCSPQFDSKMMKNADAVDLVAMENGGYVVAASDQHYGSPSNLLLPGRGLNMGDGWETRRRRQPGYDWCVIALGHPGEIKKIEVDTAYFKGNYPDTCIIQGAFIKGGTDSSLITQSMFWPILLPEQKLEMDKQHYFQEQIAKIGPVSHIRFNIVPDGGVSRLRLWGRPGQAIMNGHV